MTSLIAPGEVIRRRGALPRSAAAVRRGAVTVGFLGGSITAPKTGTRWPEPFQRWVADRFPGVRLTVENAALGATGSDLGAFRAESTVLARGCDVVFVEYAVNDYGTPSERRGRTREGLLRQLLRAGADVVLVHTYCGEMEADLVAGRVPPSIAEFEALAERYGVPSVWVGLHAWRQVRRGLMTPEEWLPDGLHPEVRGSQAYAEPVIALCDEVWGGAPGGAPCGSPPRRDAVADLPAPQHTGCWERVRVADLASVHREGPWVLRNTPTCLGLERVLWATVPGARLRLPFQGRGVVLGFDFGRLSSEVRYRIDGGAWTQTERDRPGWCGDRGWYRPVIVADDLPPGDHELDLETLAVAVPGGIGVETAIGLIGILA